jgi:hypothetical protein
MRRTLPRGPDLYPVELSGKYSPVVGQTFTIRYGNVAEDHDLPLVKGAQ